MSQHLLVFMTDSICFEQVVVTSELNNAICGTALNLHESFYCVRNLFHIQINCVFVTSEFVPGLNTDFNKV